jgi:hypothetical protein
MDNHVILRTILIILAAAVLFSLVYYYNNKQSTVSAEKFYQANNALMPVHQEPEQVIRKSQEELAGANTNAVRPSESAIGDEYRPVDFTGQKLPSDCFPKDRLSTEDLLPKDAANLKWSAVNPAGQGDVSNINFVQAGAMLGINSSLGSMRNANLQLRSDPIIPNNSADWPIMMSTIPRNSAIQRRPLEISGDCGEQ